MVAFEVFQANDRVTFALERENMAFGGGLSRKVIWSESDKNRMLPERENQQTASSVTLPPGEGRDRRDSSREHDMG